MRLHLDGDFDLVLKDWGEQEYYNKRRRKFMKTPKGKITQKKRDAQRRKLDFIPLNEPFDGSEGHHIDFECVIYIPEQLHKSIPHNIWTGRGIAEINDRVFAWLFP